ncbi:MAG: FxsA family protein [Luteococcus japonicus]|uniref:FxsA family protein n=1 Tax=Luteococcus sp. TaxID=1969402 RepID=UPI00264A466F|nr:FxsA family protein [Luteococcus sp.]MDN5562906.1 FxsA family protein [Luteococcus sp.]
MAAPRRNGWAMPLFMALLVAVPIIEVWILLRVGHAIGGLPTVAILVAEAAVGAWLMKREGSRAWQALRATLGTGRMPATELTDAALVLVGGVLLMLPGFLTDVFGFVFLLPFTRPLARRLVEVFAARQVQRAGVDMDLMRARTRPDMTIDGEVVQGETVPEPPSDGQDPPAITGRVL